MRTLLRRCSRESLHKTDRARPIVTAFQPVHNLSSGIITGVEALARFPGDVSRSLDRLTAEGEIIDIDTETAARLVNGASSHMALWIANAEQPEEVSKKAVAGFRTMLDGLRKRS